MDMFFQKPHEYISQRFYRWETVFNHQLFDLGFDTKLSSSQDAVQFKILQLSNDFDLVMISEYFDESLILLKQLLCWDFEDILYLSKNRRSSSSHYQMTSSLVSYVSQWNKADMKLYNHFNKTLWLKIKQYGHYFVKDLSEFRSRLKVVNEKCIEGSRQIYKKRRGDTEFEEYELRSDLPVSDLTFCQDLLKAHSDLYKLLKRDMITRGSIRQ
ncbi:galactosylceramide sulfotransferase-like [Anneissia japonica]|uniref:galactosylceramide sulfotransferase-like n=1 Tax=Anneissia japonica TaxID=1529436 RepID=UPI00142588B0|nr:galactosylceramide sulfotransferase-like [Anneissia japonica]